MTLLEVGLVLGALGLLFLVLSPCLHSLSPQQITRLQMDQVERGLEIYAVKHGDLYPTSGQGLTPVERYLMLGSTRDGWERDFVYCSDGLSYDLISLGADGRVGGEGADADLRAGEDDWAMAPSGPDLWPIPAARASALGASELLTRLQSCDGCADESRRRMSQMLAALGYLAAGHGGGYPDPGTWQRGLDTIDLFSGDGDYPAGNVDGWGRELLYCGGGGFAELRSLGRDGALGGEGEDADISISSYAVYRGSR